MDSPQNQCDSSFNENRQVEASRSKYSYDGCNIRPSWWLPIADTNTTRVSSQIENSFQTESADDNKCHDQRKYRSEGSASTSENRENVCTNHLKQESEDSVNGETSVNKEAVSHDAKWEIMFDRLLEFKKKYGHCLVPNRFKDDHKLGSWVSTQRKQYKALAYGRYDATTLPAHRIKKLDEIGFAWNTSDPRRVDWEVRYLQLKEFFRKYGHTLVPMGYEENLPLSNWVSVQRQEYKNLRLGLPSKLTMERLKLLDTLGFVWNAPRGAKRKRHVMTSENEDNYIQDRMNQSRTAENEVSVSIEANHHVESGWNENSDKKMKVASHVEGNRHKHDSMQSLYSPNLNSVNQEAAINRMPVINFDTYRSPYDMMSFFNPLLVSNLAMYSSLLYNPLASISSRFEAQRSALQLLYTQRNPLWHTLLDGATLSRVNIPFDNPNLLVEIPEPSSVRSSEFSTSDSDSKKKASKAPKS